MRSAVATVSRIDVREVCKSYGTVQALVRATFSIEGDESVAILGPSGSGKSTLLGILAGFVESDSGTIEFDGVRVNELPTHKRGIGMVFQRYALFPNRTVRENLAFPLETRGMPKAEIEARVRAMLDIVGLGAQADRYPSEISGGQAQRVALARALVFEPRLLLMDEPLGALDRQLRKSLQVEIRRIQKQAGVPSIYVTHDQEEAMHLADRIMLIRDGRIVADDSPARLYRTPRTVWAASFLGDANIVPLETCRPLGDGRAEVVHAGGAGEAADVHGLAGGSDRRYLMLRPEEGRVLSSGREPGSGRGIRIPGTLVSSTYLGAHQRLHVEAVGGLTLVLQVPGRDEVPPIGGRVDCWWPADYAVVVEDA